MNAIIKLILLSIGVILFGTFLMYGLEYNHPDTEITSLENALWWCIATVTTVGYGDIVPVTKLGRAVAMLYMGFGISIIAILLSTITNNFYKKKIDVIERKKEKEEMDFFKKEVMAKLLEIERKHNRYLDLYIQLHSKINNNNNNNTFSKDNKM
jgi:voltage-gated potassium channel Kch